MNGRAFTIAAAVPLCVVLTATLAFSQSPDWFLQASASDPGGRAVVGAGGRVISTSSAGGGLVAACAEDIAKYCSGENGVGARTCLTQNSAKLSGKCKAAVTAPPPADACRQLARLRESAGRPTLGVATGRVETNHGLHLRLSG